LRWLDGLFHHPMLLHVLLPHPPDLLLHESLLPTPNQTRWGQLCSPQHRAVVTVRNDPHPNQRARDRCSLEWIHREALWRFRSREYSVRHVIAGTKIWRPVRTFWDRKIHKIAGTKNIYKICKWRKQENVCELENHIRWSSKTHLRH
jgi:hypothetical protein